MGSLRPTSNWLSVSGHHRLKLCASRGGEKSRRPNLRGLAASVRRNSGVCLYLNLEKYIYSSTSGSSSSLSPHSSSSSPQDRTRDGKHNPSRDQMSLIVFSPSRMIRKTLGSKGIGLGRKQVPREPIVGPRRDNEREASGFIRKTANLLFLLDRAE